VRVVVPGARRTAMNVGVTPDGLLDVLLRVKRDYGDLPIHITENGMATQDSVDPDGCVYDPQRIEF
jgi:beta-glucosidase